MNWLSYLLIRISLTYHLKIIDQVFPRRVVLLFAKDIYMLATVQYEDNSFVMEVEIRQHSDMHFSILDNAYYFSIRHLMKVECILHKPCNILSMKHLQK